MKNPLTVRLPLHRLALLCATLLVSQTGFVPAAAASQQTQTPRVSEQEIKELDEEAARLKSKRKYDQAISVLTRALELRDKTPGINQLDIAAALSDLGELAFLAGKYDQAITFMARALSIREKSLTSDHPLIAETLSDLAALYIRQGDLVTSEPMLQRSLSIQEKNLGSDNLEVASTLNSLATLYEERGDRISAEPLYKRSLAIREKKVAEQPRLVATALNNLGRLYMANRDFTSAEPLYKRSLQIRETLLGPENPDLAVPIINLATLYYEKGEFAEAERLLQRALSLQEKGLSSTHPALINTLHNLAEVYRHQGRFDDAELLYKRSLEVASKSLGNNHSLVATILRGYSLLEEARSDYNSAASYLQRAIDIQERNLALILTAGSQSQKLLYLQTVADETDLALSLHLRNRPGNATFARLALTTILQRKGRALDVMSASIEALRRGATPEDLDLINRLAQARDQLAKLTFAVQASPKNIEAETHELETKISQLEASISSRSSRFRSQSQAVNINRVQQAIGDNTCLIEFVSYRPFDVFGKTRSESFGPLQYGAYILANSGAPSWVKLGEATRINRAVERFRQSLSSASNSDYRRAGRALDEMVMRPVRKFLGTRQKLFISPDGILNLIPFAALVDERNRYLAQRYTISYLSSGRDLLRLQVRAPSKEAPVVVANPAFDDPATADNTPPRSPSSTRTLIDFGKVTIDALPETAREAEIFKVLFPDARMFTGSQATEAAVKKVNGPSILHIATHGFFLSDRGSTPGTRSLTISRAQVSTLSVDPLLRSGLVLAGVSFGSSGVGEDGVLTALEVANLNLWGTKLVVLSACETGLGDVYVGEGVFGLRRALVLAGADSQVISLWRVSDRATRELMSHYYTLVRHGAPRADALRQVQLKMIRGRDQNFKHPFYWASFIQSGDWRAM